MIVLRNDRAARQARFSFRTAAGNQLSQGASVAVEVLLSNQQHLVVTTRSYDGNLPECFCFEQGGIPEKIF
jgi:hypothetical protein